MKWVKRKIAKWCKEAWEEARQPDMADAYGAIAVSPSVVDSPDTPPKMRFALRQAINGKFIEIATYNPQNRGSDWITEFYIVPEGKKVSEAMAMLMLVKGADE